MVMASLVVILLSGESFIAEMDVAGCRRIERLWREGAMVDIITEGGLIRVGGVRCIEGDASTPFQKEPGS